MIVFQDSNESLETSSSTPSSSSSLNIEPLMSTVPAPQWFWQDDSHPPKWMPYDPETSRQIENAAASGASETLVMRETYKIDIHGRRQIKLRTGFTRKIIRFIRLALFIFASSNSRATWFWHGDGTIYVPYDENVAQQLERAYQARQFDGFRTAVDGQRFVALSPDGRHYQYRSCLLSCLLSLP